MNGFQIPPADEPDEQHVHPSIARARALLADTDELRRDLEERRQRRMLEEPIVPPADWRGKSVAEMSSREFSGWCDAGRPPLDNDERFVTKAEWRKREASFAHALADRFVTKAERQKHDESLAALLGEEVGTIHRNLLNQIDALKTEIEALKAERFASETAEVLDWSRARASQRSAA